MRRRAALAAPLLALALTPLPGQRALAQEGPGGASASALQLLLPGRLVAATVAEEAGRNILAVVLRHEAGEDGEDREVRRHVYLYDPAERTLVPRGAPLPDGAPELAPGGTGLWVGVARFGALQVLPLPAPQPESGGEAGATLDLPRRAERTAWGLRLTSPAVQPVPRPSPDPDRNPDRDRDTDEARERTGGEAPCFATDPEAHGRRRLRVLLLCPGREPEELWGLLPGAETLTASRFGILDGTPALAVLTREKLGLFVKQDLRVIPLAGSLSRLGAAPVLAARTDCPLWRGSDLSFADADGDGREDLVVVCRTGLVNEDLRVEVYRHRGPEERGGPFDPRPRVAKIDGDFGTWHFGADWTGDGVADLLAVRDGRLQVHAGDARGRPVDSRPRRTLALPGGGDDEGGEGRVEVRAGTGGGEMREWRGGPEILAAADLDGDGRPELVVHRATKDGGELLLLTP